MAEIELTNNYAVLELPEATVAVTIEATVFVDGKLQTVKREMSMKEVQAAFKEAEAVYIPPDAVFTLTDVGRKFLEEHPGGYIDA